MPVTNGVATNDIALVDSVQNKLAGVDDDDYEKHCDEVDPEKTALNEPEHDGIDNHKEKGNVRKPILFITILIQTSTSCNKIIGINTCAIRTRTFSFYVI